MNDLATKQAIVNSLAAFASKPMAEASISLFETLGYKSQKRIALTPNSAKTFTETFAKDKLLNPHHALLTDWQSVDFLFQITDEEVRAAAQGNQQFLFESKGKWNGAAIESYLFLAITLQKPHYTRTELSGITRAVNRLFPMPAMLLFRHGETLTLAVINRRLHKRDEARDVLEKITLIKDIRFANPHRAHVEILSDLSFDALQEKQGFTNFVALHAAWQVTLDISELNKRFYQEVANWYFWALENVHFPKDAPKDAEGRDAISLIRLLTRLIFCWFIKEKGLIPDAVFSERTLASLLKDFAPRGEADNPVCPKPKGRAQKELSASQKELSAPQTECSASQESIFYKAILQNLFFATLNTEMDPAGGPSIRRFSRQVRDDHMIHTVWRHEQSITDKRAFQALFKDIPFLNGGLFECLDDREGTQEFRIDGFSDTPKSQPVAPDFLFFGPERETDLSRAYGDAKYKRARVRGLLRIFEDYKFTIEENTPIEEDVALDPELLGHVFENLLADYNPETGAVARKTTGSFYTPRVAVGFMVDEAMLVYLSEKVKQTILSAPSSGANNPVCAPSLTAQQTGCSATPAFKPYNPETETHRTHRRLPHWTQQGTTYFITFRLADSLPQEKLKQWREQRDIWLKFHPEPWSEKDWDEYDQQFGNKLEEWLDAGHGACHLAEPTVRAIVEKCLKHFDGQRYDLGDYVIMPNHVHMLLRPHQGFPLSEILKGMKGVSSHNVKQTILSAPQVAPESDQTILSAQAVPKTGQAELSASRWQFWMDESFDHIVRSQTQFRKFQRYIAENPAKAGLKPGAFALNVEQAILPAALNVEQTILSAQTDAAPAAQLQAAQTGSPSLQERLRHLFAWQSESHQFTPLEVEILITAIHDLKAIDIACGSGAFPMGLLLKLVWILRKLDPGNERWKAVQLAAIPDPNLRDATERVFTGNLPDYTRKLYLIESCLYGVDIQPIAVQIAKLRFFISLIVDQKVDGDGDAGNPACRQSRHTELSASPLPNRGVLPLPNLETKFVAANSLLGLKRGQLSLGASDIANLETELRQVRHDHFNARRYDDKKKLRKRDRELCDRLAHTLSETGSFSTADARKLATWDPYDQNASAPFFDPEWMFGLTAGFDLSIGNPPYVRQEQLRRITVKHDGKNVSLKDLLNGRFECYSGTSDLYVYFFERSLQLLKPGGVLCYISSNSFLNSGFGESLRAYLNEKTRLHVLIDFAETGVFTAITEPCIIVVAKERPPNDAMRLLQWDEDEPLENLPMTFAAKAFNLRQKEFRKDGWRLQSAAVLRLLAKLRRAGQPLANVVNGRFYYGIKTGMNEAFVVDRTTRDRLIAEHESSAEVLRPYLRGRDVRRWHVVDPGLWLVFTRHGTDIRRYPAVHAHLKPFKKALTPGVPGGRKPGSYEWYEIQDNIAYWEEFERPKIVYQEINRTTSFAWDDHGFFSNNKTFILPEASLFLLALLNARAGRYFIHRSSGVPEGGFLALQSPLMSPFPVPDPPPAERAALESLVDRILKSRQANPTADVSALEREIDDRVYRLYGLRQEEIKIVEDASA